MKLTDDVKQRKQKHFKQYRTAKQKLTNKENLVRFLHRGKPPDHKAVVLDLKILSEKRGPGLWKFNNSPVEDNKYVELIEENYAAIREKYSDLKDDRLKWELIKMEIRRLTISDFISSKHKEKQRRIRETELQKRLEALEIKINNCNTDEQLSAEIEEYDN